MSATNHTNNLHNLPTPLNTFIGRNREIAEVKTLLAEHRLLTLTGPGGCGKTRLAIRVARELPATYEDGLWLTEFAALAEADLVPQAVAFTLGVREQTGRSIHESLVNYLQSRKTLLILDNCEHLITACAQLAATLLASCPGVKILATSREPLGVPGEVVWAVPPLSLPEPQPWRNPASETDARRAYEQSEAVQLLLVRAQEASPTFSLTPENGPWIADLCRRLDGIPLAIELAAAHTRTFSIRQIVQRLDDRFQLLTSRLRTTPVRHQTLEAMLDWSYTLLSESEQKVLQRLAVFAGGWTLAAAEAVCTGDGVRAEEMMVLLANLVDKSLVQVERMDGERHFALLETIRQYAHQKLTQAGALESARERHLSYFLQWAEEHTVYLAGKNQLAWLARFNREHDNLRAALEWAQSSEARAEGGLRLAGACGLHWRLRGDLSEGRARLTAILNHPGTQERNLARAKALLWNANLAYLQSDYPATRFLAQEALEIGRELGASGRAEVAWALDLLGETATEVGDYETAPGLLTESLAIYRELGDQRGTADMLMQLGWAAMRVGDYEKAATFLEECLALFRTLGETFMIAAALAGLGELAVRQERLEQAKVILAESLALRREIGERWGMATSLGSLGWVALLQRDFDEMRTLLAESLALRLEVGDQGGIAWCLEKLAAAMTLQASALPLRQRRQPLQRAARILGTAVALREPLGSVVDPADQPDYDRLVNDLRRALGQTAFAQAWAAGRDLPLTEVVELALQPVTMPEPVGDKLKYGGLSPRERETAVLIAQSKSNRDIAEAMVVRVKTVETYVTRILNKLGFDSRVQIATWAHDVGLIDADSDNP
ncbi:MAG: adenylate/guanylate cyclase domain-containing protein [Bacteroidetes bacterium]|nr:MAG: adenylate/guanylate cyclase domain-containing protein [Bacteroidota bacterium]